MGNTNLLDGGISFSTEKCIIELYEKMLNFSGSIQSIRAPPLYY